MLQWPSDTDELTPATSKRRRKGKDILDPVPKRLRYILPKPKELQIDDQSRNDSQATTLAVSAPNSLTFRATEDPDARTLADHPAPFHHLLPVDPTQSPVVLYSISSNFSDEEDLENAGYSTGPFEVHGNYDAYDSQCTEEYLTGYSGVVWDNDSGSCASEQTLPHADVPLPEVKLHAFPSNHLNHPITHSNDPSAASMHMGFGDENAWLEADYERGTQSTTQWSEQPRETGDLVPVHAEDMSLSHPPHQEYDPSDPHSVYAYPWTSAAHTARAGSPLMAYLRPVGQADKRIISRLIRTACLLNHTASLETKLCSVWIG